MLSPEELSEMDRLRRNWMRREVTDCITPKNAFLAGYEAALSASRAQGQIPGGWRSWLEAAAQYAELPAAADSEFERGERAALRNVGAQAMLLLAAAPAPPGGA